MKRSLYSVISLMLMMSIGLSGCIVSPDAETADGGADGGADVVGGQVPGGTEPNPCDRDAADSPDMWEGSGAGESNISEEPAPPDDCTFNGCEMGFSCEFVTGEETCVETTFQECLCNPETGDIECTSMPGEPRCWVEQGYECVPLPPPSAACVGPNPAETCLDTGCEEGFVCQPSDEPACVSPSCFCDVDTWVCTDDCGTPLECVPE